MKPNLRSIGIILYVIGFAIIIYLIVQSLAVPPNQINYDFNIIISIIALVLVAASFILRRRSRKSETKQNAS